jgi:L-fucose mutarotase
MLKSIDPMLGPDLLATLRAMGHGDDIAIVDSNFPASSMGRPVIRMDGIDAVRILDAVLSVMPLDTFVPDAAWRMEVVGDPKAVLRARQGRFRRGGQR